ncbi:Cys-tRNA(Pro) deacylase [Ectobacillus sp. JY-23]|uniref:Cys-tRNA(Pro) deacylase n=1 Tax=Ectobacillus sp. JY-23 TaxID=2933872 RepID=UPI001FF4579F|nr:Cys-tRNA(Pro) deacylase [Ectobacillus sp. JY-23]UOY93066.1 Cys-tRNA(Pro) deacylase [Ectobacillus sp. JY-23]
MASKTIACRLLDTKKIAYTLHEYEWDENNLDAKHVANLVGLPYEQVFKTLVLKGDKTGVVMTCIPANSELNMKALSSISGNKKVEMVPVKDIQSLTGYIRGGVSPLGVKKRYPLYVDKSASAYDTISISAGKRGLQIFLNGTEFIEITDAKTADLT